MHVWQLPYRVDMVRIRLDGMSSYSLHDGRDATDPRKFASFCLS